MTRRPVLDAALACAAVGWPVLPCLPGRKTPATKRGVLDATTDQRQLTAWFARRPDRNLAIATGAPGPDVLDVDTHPGDGFAALNILIRVGLARGAAAVIRTPSGGAHLYFTGSGQRNGHLPGRHLDFRSSGGYVLAPPSQVGGQPYVLIARPGGTAGLDWAAVTAVLQPRRHLSRAERRPPVPGTDIARLAAWVARQEEGNRNAGLYWAACRALEASQAADLSPLAIAARQAGLGDHEIRATLGSARKTTGPRPIHPDHQVEAVT